MLGINKSKKSLDLREKELKTLRTYDKVIHSELMGVEDDAQLIKQIEKYTQNNLKDIIPKLEALCNTTDFGSMALRCGELIRSSRYLKS
jgi:hypothetical protein